MDTAIQIIQNVGEDYLAHFKEIAFKTTRRDVRASLINHLSKKIIFTDAEQSLINILIHLFYFIPHFFPLPLTLCYFIGESLS